jgi:citrate lyase subunit beta/citryl-CoA lyase
MTSDVPRPPSRRACLLVPGANARQLEGASRMSADEVVLDIGGADPAEVDVARATVIEVLRSVDYGDALVSVRISALTAPWAYRDVVDVVEQAGDLVDCIVVPGARSAADVEFVDMLLGMIEQRLDIGHTIGIEAEVSLTAALGLLDDVAVAADRLDALVFDGAALAAALGARSTTDLLDAARLRVLAVARATALAVVEGPYAHADDADGFTAHVRRATAQGVDGVWCVHPRQLSTARAAGQ